MVDAWNPRLKAFDNQHLSLVPFAGIGMLRLAEDRTESVFLCVLTSETH